MGSQITLVRRKTGQPVRSAGREPASEPAGSSLEAAAPGLCATCQNAATCMHRRRATQPVIFCEEFQLATSATPRAVAKAGQTGGSVSPEQEAPPLGLCANCEERHSCLYARAAGGVWHCELYR
jgi:hypothetical protein